MLQKCSRSPPGFASHARQDPSARDGGLDRRHHPFEGLPDRHGIRQECERALAGRERPGPRSWLRRIDRWIAYANSIVEE